MHNYLRAIGFSNLQNEKDIKEILTEVFHDFDEKQSFCRVYKKLW